MIKKLCGLHPLMALSYWDIRENFRLAVVIEGRRNIPFGRIILFLGVLVAILGATYLGALVFRAWAEEAGIIDVIADSYYVLGFPLLAIIGLVCGAIALVLSVLAEEDRDMWLRSLLIERDFSLYKGFASLLGGFCFLLFFFAAPFLLFGKVVLREDIGHFLSGGLVIFALSFCFIILGGLFMSFVVACIPPRARQRVLVGLAIFIALLLIGAAKYFFWVGNFEIFFGRVIHILTNPYVPTAWAGELFLVVQGKGWLAGESLMRLFWLIGLVLATGVAFSRVLPLIYRPGEGSKEIVDISLPIRLDAKFATLLARLPLGRSTRAFLKRDLILYFRNPSASFQSIVLVGIVLTVTLLRDAPIGFSFMLYYVSALVMTYYLFPSLKTEGGNMDYIKMLLGKGNFIVAKVVATSLAVLLFCLILLFGSYTLSPALEWDWSILVRILIVSFAALLSTLLGMVYGEKILISGKQRIEDHLLWFVFATLLAIGWLNIDLLLTHPYLTDPQIVPRWATVIFLLLSLIIFGGIMSYCILRLRKFARAMEDI